MSKENFFIDEIKNVWIAENEPEEDIIARFAKLNPKFEILYKFVWTYSSYSNVKKDYGSNEGKLSVVEAHVLVDIVENPGITVGELAKKWEKTPSALSQTVKTLINGGYVYREISDKNAKFFYLHPTDKAKKFTLCHKHYDNVDVVKTFKKLMKKFSPREMDTFFKVLQEYTKIIVSKG
ncbi:MAG: MarR family transcriptional regulator [Fusobacteriaceae bacterium]|jgi:DNA-binding MarR family transcriptional regulator|nr:MarR family transcriptional regulator [Fusobacteriaceae bacterium]